MDRRLALRNAAAERSRKRYGSVSRTYAAFRCAACRLKVEAQRGNVGACPRCGGNLAPHGPEAA